MIVTCEPLIKGTISSPQVLLIGFPSESELGVLVAVLLGHAARAQPGGPELVVDQPGVAGHSVDDGKVELALQPPQHGRVGRRLVLLLLLVSRFPYTSTAR